MVDFDEKDILQFDAVIIAGVLILLTLVSSVSTPLQLYAKVTMGAATIPFILSAFILLFENKKAISMSERARLRGARLATSLGLLYLVLAVIGLLIAISPSS